MTDHATIAFEDVLHPAAVVMMLMLEQLPPEARGIVGSSLEAGARTELRIRAGAPTEMALWLVGDEEKSVQVTRWTGLPDADPSAPAMASAH